jgi:chemotaxis response regulator CheB
MGSDGTLGLKAIKENLGMVMVQDPASAKYDGMPRSAINTGHGGLRRRRKKIPAKLIQYVNHAGDSRKIAICQKRNHPPRSKRSLSCCAPTPATTSPATRETRSPPDRTADERPPV